MQLKLEEAVEISVNTFLGDSPRPFRFSNVVCPPMGETQRLIVASSTSAPEMAVVRLHSCIDSVLVLDSNGRTLPVQSSRLPRYTIIARQTVVSVLRVTQPVHVDRLKV